MITVIGSLNLDLFGTVGSLPRPGETVAGRGFVTSPGGKGANQALAARRAGAPVRMFGAVGDDAFAEQALALLRADGIDLDTVDHIPDTSTGIAMVLVDDRGENSIAVFPGANGSLDARTADHAAEQLGKDDILLLQQEVPHACTERALDQARLRGAVSVLNTAPFLATTAAAAKKADIVIANEIEFGLLCDGAEGGLDDLMAEWASRHGNTIIVTLGAAGARAVFPGGRADAAAPQIVPVDTVGAGDTFCGYLGAGLDSGMSLDDAMRQAVAAASLACLAPGAQPAIPYRDAVSGTPGT